MKKSRFQIVTPTGALVVSLTGHTIAGIDLRTRPLKNLPPARNENEKRIAAELKAYFSHANTPLRWPIQIEGSDYQQRIWQALREIPAGSVKTYGQLAAEVGGSPRSVGNACRQNPVPIYIPCHRVVARNGLGGFAGKTAGPRLELKRWLLQHEGARLPA
jgi:methylated-DNA-[protein]-cysteine S-methyltransferase